MQGQSTLKINDIFWSFQGEGLRAGFPSIFLRLAGCSIQCQYCDTKYSWTEGNYIKIIDIISKIDYYREKYPESQIVITGGEPLEQDLSKIVNELKKRGYFISIETNGINFQDIELDWWSISPKDTRNFYINEKLTENICEVKLIVNRNLNVSVIEKIRALRDDFPIFLQPDYFDKDKYKNTYSIFQLCQKRGVKNIRPGFQLHRIFKVK